MNLFPFACIYYTLASTSGDVPAALCQISKIHFILHETTQHGW